MLKERKEFEAWLHEECGLQVYALLGNGNEKIYMNPRVLGVGVTINYSTESFRFEYMLPNSTFFLDSGEMSPCSKKDFFYKQYVKFLDTSIKIKEVC